MSTSAIPHLNFAGGQARQALEFYRDVFAGDLLSHTYQDFGMPAGMPDSDRIVFGQITTADGVLLMGYDIPGTQAPDFGKPGSTRRANGTTITEQPMFVTLRSTSLAEAEALWKRLAVNAVVVEDFASSTWSPGFGIVTDQYGVTWLVNAHE
ncbi:VOC family protein [Actinoplanes sp. NBRC 101535]|uniref:VOC family protein n=1 Tax=Actinoplanes sp. NBRC 101535 TaxID=3032196 RepID=UPI0024A054DA|nr:VOC family protein [Actinoplanes sp. NBRC 101535]GLY06361.1 VOC family protein [Actinoplanes sp. NBRC 101535]